MHPVFARFMDFATSQQTLARREAQEAPSAEEATWLSIADAFPEARDVIRNAEAHDEEDPDVVEPLILLAAHAALRALSEDARFTAPLAEAKASLEREGASAEQAETLVASLILEEAFDEDQDADSFDADFISSSLTEVPALAALTLEAVEALRGAFVGVPKDPVRKAAFEALVQEAWEEGPQFVNGEHLEAALARARGSLNKDQRPLLPAALEALLTLLAQRGLVSERRRARLSARLARAA